GFLGVFALIVGGITWLEFRARRVSNGEDVAQGLRIRVIGTLPPLTGQARRRMGQHESPNQDWHSRFTASVDAVRTMVVHAARLDSLRTIMVTSAMGGEGKTMLSAHLAISLACSGYRT